MGKKQQIRDGESDAKSRGFSLLELSIAMAVLLVGLLGGIVVISVAATNNGRSKIHTTAATLAESTMEKILAIPQSATGAAAQTQITDCAGNTFTIETSQGGSPTISVGAFSGAIDFNQPPKANYSMTYAMCSSSKELYDVRWRVDAGPTQSTQLITVSAKSVSANRGALFTLPYTLHELRGNF
ncbi:MAG TPA: prepilin-type N-terminal cleavage/methylation domain-containing protein [Candidatus Angelobacter sp.]|nr:prepilin-type N-terminal cleavage/methylation domain-containing protein [Candidatus Angelobacter sp.]